MRLTPHRYKLLTIVAALLALFVITLAAPTAAPAQQDDFQLPEGFGEDAFDDAEMEQALEDMEEAEGWLAWIAGLGIGGMLLIVAIEIAIFVAIILAVSGCFKRVPPEHRKMQPGMVWLLIIPCLNVIWNFVVVLRLADSYKSYFDAAGRTDVGDCGKGIGLGYAVGIIVCAPVGLILLIVWLIKVLGLKKLIPEGGAAPAAGA